MAVAVVVDSGPLLALFDRDDGYHNRAVAWLSKFSGRLLSNAAVITEVAHLLDFNPQSQVDFLRWVGNGGLSLVELGADDMPRIAELIEKYADLPADFTDASLVVACERLGIRDIASVDRDFDVYRFRKRGRFRNVFLAR
jgi:predicted nucleic acid-binding protein